MMVDGTLVSYVLLHDWGVENSNKLDVSNDLREVGAGDESCPIGPSVSISAC